MKNTTTLWVAIIMVSVGLAGCTGGGELDMLVTPADDPVTEPFLFEATGPSYDSYEWDFNDGTPVVQGEEVEHTFGFTNGDIVVRLTAQNEGEEPITIARTVDLGGGRNTNPDGVMTTNTYWVDPGEPFAVTSMNSSDPDGDPLLYRWTVERTGDLIPPDTSHPPHEGLGGLPFGVDAWAGLDPSLTVDGTDYGEDLVAALDATKSRPWSTAETAIQGSITEPGGYQVELFIKDPKGTPWVGRLNLYVAGPERFKPDETATLSVEGTFAGGGDGTFQALYNGESNPDDTPAPSEITGDDNQTFDRIEYPFQVVIPSLEGSIDFSYSGGTAESSGETVAQYRIYPVGSDGQPGSNAIGPTSESRTFGKDVLKSRPNGSPRDYVLEIALSPGHSQVDVEFDMTIVNDLDPLNWYERL